MIFSSRYQIDIPAVDILTYVFGAIQMTTLQICPSVVDQERRDASVAE